jgi:hypothetical protein
MYTAIDALKLDRLDVIYPGKAHFFLDKKVRAIPLQVALGKNKK